MENRSPDQIASEMTEADRLHRRIMLDHLQHEIRAGRINYEVVRWKLWPSYREVLDEMINEEDQ